MKNKCKKDFLKAIPKDIAFIRDRIKKAKSNNDKVLEKALRQDLLRLKSFAEDNNIIV